VELKTAGKKKMLFLRANPRKTGFSEGLFNLFVNGAREFAEIIDIDLTKENVSPCYGCYHCWTNTPGICIQHDAMSSIIDHFKTADLMVIATPLYAFGVSSYCKMFLERTFPLLAPGLVLNDKNIELNKLRFPDCKPSSMAVLLVGGLKSAVHADGAIKTLESYAEGFGMKFGGALVRTESFILQFAGTKPKTVKNIEHAFLQAGAEFAESECISKEISDKAALQLAPDIEYFEKYSNIYWQYASDVSKRGGSIEEAKELTNRDSWILMHEMSRSIDPVATSGLKASFQFDFPDIGKVFTITVDKGKSSITETAVHKPDVVIKSNSNIWVGVLQRELDPLKQLANGEIVLSGDKSLFRKLHLYFPPPGL
jgi:multimeric flavodoxin WrbA/putative sterol carrier protein